MVNTLVDATQHLSLLMMICLSVAILMCSEPAMTQPLTPGLEIVEYKKYCSSSLSDAIHLICGGRYNSLGRKFRKSF